MANEARISFFYLTLRYDKRCAQGMWEADRMCAHGPLRHCHGTNEFSMISDLDRQGGEAMLQTAGTHADSQKLMGEYDARGALTDRASDATKLTSWFA